MRETQFHRGVQSFGAVIFGAIVGTAAMVAPALALVGFGAFTAGAVAWRRLANLTILALAGLLLGYAFLGRGFAHLGFYPIFVGEAVLATGIAALAGTRISRALRLPLVTLLAPFLMWNIICTIPHIADHGVDSLRDAVVWGYAIFSVLIGLLVTTTSHIEVVHRFYRRCIPIFLAWTPVLLYLFRLRHESLPRAPGSEVPIVGFVPGDTAVHLAGIAAFMILRPDMPRRTHLFAALGGLSLWMLWSVDFIAVSSLGRGGMLSIVAGVLVAGLLRFSIASWLRAGFLAAFVGLILVALDPQVDIGAPRNLSVRQVVTNLGSVTGEVNHRALDSTREWRLTWWKKIVDYTFRGPYFWAGKGFGINLADADGFQVEEGQWPLRSPHNGHLTILARSGVVGLALWVLLQGGFGLSLLRAYRRSRKRRDPLSERSCAWILAYWLAAQVNVAFSTALESPHAGIWLWCIIGFGLSVLHREQAMATRHDHRRVVGSATLEPSWMRSRTTC